MVLVDDYDVLTTAGLAPLAPFLPYIPSAVDIGLHFVLTRRVAGASRGMYEPLMQGLRESGASAVVMAGDRSEGQLFPGVYATQQAVRPRRAHPQRPVEPPDPDRVHRRMTPPGTVPRTAPTSGTAPTSTPRTTKDRTTT